MPRYFFHFSDGKRTFKDNTGTDCVSLAHAREHAVSQLRELKSVMYEQTIQNWVGWNMIAVDATGKTVLEVGFDPTASSLH